MVQKLRREERCSAFGGPRRAAEVTVKASHCLHSLHWRRCRLMALLIRRSSSSTFVTLVSSGLLRSIRRFRSIDFSRNWIASQVIQRHLFRNTVSLLTRDIGLVDRGLVCCIREVNRSLSGSQRSPVATSRRTVRTLQCDSKDFVQRISLRTSAS
jgi:hypothetical protein